VVFWQFDLCFGVTEFKLSRAGDMARKTWDIGNLFSVPLIDGSHALGQVVGREAEVLNSITCVFFRNRIGGDALTEVKGPPDCSDAIAVQFVTKDLLTRRIWKVLGDFAVCLPLDAFPHEDKRNSGWIGARVIGSGIVEHFLNAYFGLEPWTQMKDPAYFDRLLLRPDLRPF
jgi:hypothetical protein